MISEKRRGRRHIPDFSAVIFDMDGLVLDSESSYVSAWKMATRSMGYQITDDFWPTLSGLQYCAVKQMMFDYCGPDFDCHYFSRLSGLIWRDNVGKTGIAVKPGVYQLLELLRDKRVPYCLATNSGKENALDCLHYAGLDGMFPFIVSRDSVEHGKPSPEIFIKSADKLTVPISECMILEDSATGIAAAAQTAALSVFIPSVLPADPEALKQADLVFYDLTTWVEIIECQFF